MVIGIDLSTHTLSELERWRSLHGETSVADVLRQTVHKWAASRPVEAAEKLRELTPRQRQVLKLICEQKTTKAIAQQLRVDVKTVESHRTGLMRKLNVRCVAGLVRFAIRAGLLGA